MMPDSHANYQYMRLKHVYGGYAIKLLRLQNEMIQTFERYQRGNKQTVEVRGTLAKRGLMSPPGQGPIHHPTKKGGHCGGHPHCAPRRGRGRQEAVVRPRRFEAQKIDRRTRMACGGIVGHKHPPAEGAFEGMWDGTVDVNWAKEHRCGGALRSPGIRSRCGRLRPVTAACLQG
jgi:hypothetical protein